MFLGISISSNISEIVDDVMAGSFTIRQSKTILARSRKAGHAFIRSSVTAAV
jgi:hypothetical protein